MLKVKSQVLTESWPGSTRGWSRRVPGLVGDITDIEGRSIFCDSKELEPADGRWAHRSVQSIKGSTLDIWMVRWTCLLLWHPVYNQQHLLDSRGGWDDSGILGMSLWQQTNKKTHWGYSVWLHLHQSMYKMGRTALNIHFLKWMRTRLISLSSWFKLEGSSGGLGWPIITGCPEDYFRGSNGTSMERPF